MLKLKLVKGKTVDEADDAENVITPAGDFNHGTKLLI